MSTKKAKVNLKRNDIHKTIDEAIINRNFTKIKNNLALLGKMSPSLMNENGSYLHDSIKKLLKTGDVECAYFLSLKFREIFKENLVANLLHCAVVQQIDGKSIASKIFREFLSNNPTHKVKSTYSDDKIKIGTVVNSGSGDINFHDGSFSLSRGHSESMDLVNENNFENWIIFSDNANKKDYLEFDIIFNAISDPDIFNIELKKIIPFINASKANIINHPNNNIRNTRDWLYGQLKEIDDIIIPKTLKINSLEFADGRLCEFAKKYNISYPFLIRPAGSQTGVGLNIIQNEVDASKIIIKSGEFYLTEFYDFASKDGYYRKYRFWNIGDEVIPSHLFINSIWNVHRSCRLDLMKNNIWMIEEEKKFLIGDFIFNDRIKKAIANLREIIGLEYFGVDCSFCDDGRIIIFEANSTMRSASYLEFTNDFSYLRDVFINHSAAFKRMIAGKLEKNKIK